ncbi:MAG: SUMF1/EgtB/PvdO family nonheme iron enzyme [Rikenellaceae bacterium]
MVYVQDGTFQMGDGPSVTLSDYYIGKYEVTQGEWEAVTGRNPSHFKGSNKPVELVTWYDCVKFCNALSRKQGLEECYTIIGNKLTLDMSKNGYRLPTEAEWEFAARGGNKTKNYEYSGSDNVKGTSKNWILTLSNFKYSSLNF